SVEILLKSAAEYRDGTSSHRLAVLLHHLGESYEAMGDALRAAASYEESLAAFERRGLALYEASRLQVTSHPEETYARAISLRADSMSAAFDPIRALDWLERSKSRVFAEVLGLSRLEPHSPTDAMRDQLNEEGRHLASVAQLRAALFIEPESSADQ